MIKSLRTKLENRLPTLVLILLVIQPAMDVLSYFLTEFGSNALSTLLRFTMLAVVAFLGFFLSDNKKLYLVFYGVTAAFWVAHAANCFRIGYASPVADAANFLRILNFPIFTLAFITFFKKGENVQKSVYIGFAINLCEIIIFTALPWLMGKPVYTYAKDLNIGVMGWFSTPSAQSAIILLVVPIAILWAYRTNKYPLFLLISLLSFSLMFVTGTKFTFYSIFIITAAFSFVFIINLKRKSLKYVLPLLAVFVVAFGLRGKSPMALREQRSATAESNYANLVNNTIINSGADDEIVNAIKNGFDAAHSDEELLEKVRRSLIGVYTDKDVYGQFYEKLYERFGVYNVMDSYDNTSESTILSDSRVRKTTFTKLIWKEKDFVTRLFGFEYSEVLAGDEVYDLENDFPAVFYFCGYLGFGLYMLFFVYFAFVILRAFFRDVAAVAAERKGKPGNPIVKGFGSFWQGVCRFLTLEMSAVGMTFVLALLTAQISGSVLRRPNVTVYFAAAAACIYQLTIKARKDEKPHDLHGGF